MKFHKAPASSSYQKYRGSETTVTIEVQIEHTNGE
jgi:hypothetical protein